MSKRGLSRVLFAVGHTAVKQFVYIETVSSKMKKDADAAEKKKAELLNAKLKMWDRTKVGSMEERTKVMKKTTNAMKVMKKTKNAMKVMKKGMKVMNQK